jgi:putative serine protease PepD
MEAMETSDAPAPSKGRKPWAIIAIGVAAGLVVGGVIGGLIVAATDSSSSAAVCSATSVANQTLPSVVTISVKSGAGGSTGSGEVIRSDGYILTNNHVISAAASGGTIDVLFNNGTSVPATLTGRDPKADIAVIKVNGQSSLSVIPFADSSKVVVGQPVVALGAPLGLSNTVTSGIISALDRTVEVPGDNGQSALLVAALQTDAAINPGNSGGALVNCSGQLVGVPSAGATAPVTGAGGSSTGSIGLGFAIPSNLAQSLSNEIISTGTVTHAYFGLQVITIPPEAAKRAGLSGGVYVEAVVPGGPADQAGLQAGDVITELNGQPATSAQQIEALTLTEKPGDKVSVTYVRNGKSATTTITLGTQP